MKRLFALSAGCTPQEIEFDEQWTPTMETKEMIMQDMIGKTIIWIGIDEEKKKIGLKFSDGSKISLNAEGDCCSESWFDHLRIYIGYCTEHDHDIEMLVKSVEMERPDINLVGTRQEVDRICVCEISGQCKDGYDSKITIELRNSSNGYYNGEIRTSEFDESLKEIREGF